MNLVVVLILGALMALPGDSGVPRPASDWLAGVYREAMGELREVVLRPPGTTTSSQAFRRARAAELSAQVDTVLAGLRVATADWVGDKATFAAAMKAGSEQAERQALAAGVRPPESLARGSFGLLDRGAVEVLARDAYGDLVGAADRAGERAKRLLRQTSQMGLDESDVNRILAGGVIRGEPAETARRLREALRRVHGDTVTVIGRDGGEVNFEAGHYASMVARTKTRQAVEMSRHERLRSLGIDLVAVIGRVSDNFCTAFLGKVFSLSGEHPRYPAISELPGGSGPPFHPNCSKSTRAYVERLASPEEQDRAQGASGASAMLGMSPAKAQRVYGALQVRQQVAARLRPRTPTPDAAVAQARQLTAMGVKDVNLGGRPDIGGVVVRGLKRAVVAGGHVPASIKVDASLYEKRQGASVGIASFYASTDTIAIDPRWPGWKDLEATVRRNRESRQWSSGDADHPMLHEVAHASHFAKIGTDLWRRTNRPFRREADRVVAASVSRYAATNRLEFVAEVWSATVAGATFGQAVMDLYRKMKGP